MAIFDELLQLPTWQLVALGFALFVVYELVYHSDGSAIGCARRPDLALSTKTVPIFGDLLWLSGETRLLEILRAERDVILSKGEKRPLSITMPFTRMIDVTKPEHIEYVQSSGKGGNFVNYEKGAIQRNFMKSTLGQGIFAVDGELWNVQRKATSKIFSANNFRGVITRAIDQDIAKLVKIVGNYADKQEPFDLQKLFFAFTLSSFANMAFGQDIGALNETGEPVPFATAFDYAQSRMDARVFEPQWPVSELFSAEGRKMRAANKTIDDFSYDIIDRRAVDAKKVQDGEKAPVRDLLTLYMELRDERGQPLSRKMLRDAVTNLLIAGRDTTAQALSWTYFHLLLNPKTQEPMRKEVDNWGEVDYDHFKDMKETLAVFSEGLRLHPSVPKNLKTVVADDVIPNGPTVQKGDFVIFSDWGMNREASVWGPDATEFKPSRWIEPDGSLANPSVWKYHVFNGGARLCLGMNLAKFEAVSVLAALTREFDLDFAEGYLDRTEMIQKERTPRYAGSLTLPMLHPLQVVAKRRQK